MNTDTTSADMIAICPVDTLSVDRGAAALLPDDTQIGVFLLEDGTVHAIQQHDPYSGTNILSRGLVGTHRIAAGEDAAEREVRTIASPMFKQVWDMDTGAVIDAAGRDPQPIRVFDAEIRDGVVHVRPVPRPLPESGA